MSNTTTTPISQMTRADLEHLIATVVRRVVREELQNASYLRSDGVRVKYVAEEAAPDYRAELQADYQALQAGQTQLVDEQTVLNELRELGVDA
jgi:hypothetical protein